MLSIRAILLGAFLFPSVASWAQDIEERRVQFDPGTSGAVIEAGIKGDEIQDYLLAAEAGQRITIELDTDNASAYFNLLAGAEPEAIHIGSISGNTYDGLLKRDGDYRVRVYLVRAAARRGEAADFRLSVSITGEPTEVIRDDFADGLAGGPDHWRISNLSQGSTLNIRSAPGTGNEVLGTLRRGDVVENGGCRRLDDDKWCIITTSAGVTGWVSGDYLRESAPPVASQTKPAESAETGSAGTGTERAEEACKQELANTANKSLSDIVVFDVLPSEAGIGVMMTLAGADKPWSCLADADGNVQGLMYTGEG